MSLMNYMMAPMGGQPHPMAQAMGAPPMNPMAQMNPMFWAGLGMLSDSGYSPTPQGPGRGIRAAMGGLQMGSALAQQEQAQQLEWAKLQSEMYGQSLQAEKMRMEIDEARRKRRNARRAQELIGAPASITGEIQEGPAMPGQLPPGIEMTPGSGYLGGEVPPEVAGAQLGLLGPEYKGLASELMGLGAPAAPLKPKDRFMTVGKSIYDVTGDTPRYVGGEPIGGAGGAGVAGGNLWGDKVVQKALSGITESDFRPESVRDFALAVQSGDPNAHAKLQRWGTFEGPNLTPAVVQRFSDKFDKNTETARKGRSSIKSMMMALNEPGGVTDVATLYGFIKAIDPGSVVREGEVAIVTRAQGIITNLKSMLQKNIGNKGFLTPDMRRQLSRIGEGLMQHYEESYNSLRNHYEEKILPNLGGASSAMVLGPRMSFDAPALDPRFAAPGPASAGNQPTTSGLPPNEDAEYQNLLRLEQEEAARVNSQRQTGVAR